MGFRDAFRRGRNEGFTRRGFAPPRSPFEPPERWTDEAPPEQPAAEPADFVAELQALIVELEADCEKKKQALDGLAPIVEQQQARVVELVAKLRDREAECETKTQALDGLLPVVEQQQARIAALETECDQKTQALDGLVPIVEQLQARIAELETMPDAAELFVEVLRLPAISTKSVKVPSVKNLLMDRFHYGSVSPGKASEGG
jgi:chromosome segregation ATPase